ncbi:MAG: OprO/OprP family phosphate-selective porin [Planctomycetia bacterium]
MANRLALAVLASGLAAFAFAGVSHADDAVKKLVKDEIKAYMDKKKEEDTKGKVFKASWKDGLSLETPDKAFTMKIGGRIHLDTAFVDDDDLDTLVPAQDIDDQTFFRRLRLVVSGDIDTHVDYKIQLDFATPQSPVIRDAWITLKKLKDCLGCWVPDVRAGHQYEPIGLETTSSSNHNAFIERSLTSALHPERQVGLNFLDSFWNERATSQLGVFGTDLADDADGLSVWDSEENDGGYAFTGRFTLVPWAKDTCRFLHLGASASYRTTDEVRFRARPGLGYGNRLVDTGTLGNLAEDNLWIWNGELALVWNSFHMAAEYTVVDMDDATREDPSFKAWYVQAGWFLTGESKAYSFKTGTWGNNKPCCNFLSNDCCCWGAFELVARYDTIDLNDGTIEGGEMANIAAGLNWYLNPNMRIMFNVVFSTTEDKTTGDDIDDADVTSFLMRWDVHF